MGKFKTLDLFPDCLDHFGVAVPEAGDRGAPRSVEVTLTGAVDDVNTVTLYRERHAHLTIAGKNVAHVIPGFAGFFRYQRVWALFFLRLEPGILNRSNINVNHLSMIVQTT
jgi:hypothetical protein